MINAAAHLAQRRQRGGQTATRVGGAEQRENHAMRQQQRLRRVERVERIEAQRVQQVVPVLRAVAGRALV